MNSLCHPWERVAGVVYTDQSGEDGDMGHKNLDEFHAYMREHEMDYLKTRSDPHRCATCGLPDAPEYGDPHECPPGFLV